MMTFILYFGLCLFVSHYPYYQVVANYSGTKKVYEPVRGVHILWPGGHTTPPKDTPQCGFKQELCSKYGTATFHESYTKRGIR